MATLPYVLDATSSEGPLVPWLSILRGLNGVVMATKTPNSEVYHITKAILSVLSAQGSSKSQLSDLSPSECDAALSFRAWLSIVDATDLEESLCHQAKLAVVITFLMQSGRQKLPVHTVDLDYVWSIVREALMCTMIQFTVSRSAQGFLAIPLWSLIKEGNIEELFRLHLPDGKRGIADLAIHAHQPFAQSWILAGKGTDYTYDAQHVDADSATHAEFSIAWSDSSGPQHGKMYRLIRNHLPLSIPVS